MKCISHKTAIKWIVKTDILSVVLIFTIVKAIGAKQFKDDKKSIKNYLNLR